MRIQLSEYIYDSLTKSEPKYVATKRGLRNVLVSSLLNLLITTVHATTEILRNNWDFN